MSPHEFLPGRPFAPETFLYQLGVGLQSFLASRHPASPSASHHETQSGPKKFPAVCGSERSCKHLSNLFDPVLYRILSAMRS
jgi:hypothetical protein